MKKELIEEGLYVFNASEKTITFTSTLDVTLHNLLLITNVTNNNIIYNFACDGYGGTIDSLTLTLEQDTTSMSDGDTLQIIMAVDATIQEQRVEELIGGSNEALSCLNNILEQQKLTNVWLKEILR